MDTALENAINIALPIFNTAWNAKSFIGGIVEVPMSTLGFSISETRVNEFVAEIEKAMKSTQLINKITYQKAQPSQGMVAAFMIS